MTLHGEYEPSPEQWVRDQVAAYESSGGTEATTLQGVPVVVVTSVGARSGKLRKNPVMRVEHEGRYALVASKGGAPQHPTWYHNLVAHPRVELQDGADRLEYTVRLADGQERDDWWDRAVQVWPAYAEYQVKTDRQIPVFVAEPADSDDSA
jgi:F420H(2)-dependent quinone reductase